MSAPDSARGAVLTGLLAALLAAPATGASYPPPAEAEFLIRDFRFASGESLPELRVHYRTLGTPRADARGVVRNAVLILHGTGGSGASLMRAEFAGELFAPGQPLDAARFFIVLPDGIGHGKSSKPSDGLHARFPRYGYQDMVEAEFRLLTQGLHVNHARLVMGTSMGGMHTWLWGEQHPQFMDTLMPLASLPTQVSGRNRVWRRLIIDAIRNDPDWKDGNYTTQPRAFKAAAVFFGVATSGGTLAYQKLAPTRERADKLLDERLAAPFTADANDTLYQWDSSRGYNPSPDLERIQATLLAINSSDDERYPPETGLVEREIKRVKGARLFLIRASEDTGGHGTTGSAKWWKKELEEILKSTPH